MQQDHDVRRTVAGLTRLLAFADAVGTTRGVMAACLTQLGELHMKVELPGSPDSTYVTLDLDGRGYYFEDYEDEHQPWGCQHLAISTAHRDIRFVSGTCTPYSADQRLFRQRVAQQIESLLHLAHKLELQPLIDRLHTFVASSTARDMGILWGVLEAVFTDRALSVAVAGRATQAGKDAWIDSVLTTPCGLAPDAPVGALLEPMSRVPGVMHFDAQLCAPFMGSRAGDTVEVRLDLFHDSTIRIGSVEAPVVLQIGPSRGSPGRRRIMSYDMQQESASPTSSQDTGH